MTLEQRVCGKPIIQLQRLDMSCQPALVSGGFILMDKSARRIAIQNRRHFRESCVRRLLVLGFHGPNNLSDQSAEH